MTASLAQSAYASKWIRALGDRIASFSKEHRLTIITYHRILECEDLLLETEPDLATFRWQMEVLATNFNVLPLYDAVQALRNGTLPPRAVCISFDDGYRSTHDLALPVLQEYGLPATVFVTSAYLGEGNMWNDRILEAIRSVPDGDLDLSSIEMGQHRIANINDRKDLLKKVNDGCKYLNPQRRLDVIEQLEQLTGNKITPALMLTREMVASLSRSGVEIGGHTVNHPILTKLPDELARKEIVDNKHQLEEIIGKPVRLFAYPNGKVGMDFDQRHMHIAREAGFAAAFTTSIGAVEKDTDLYQIPRSRPWDKTPLMFQLRLLRWLAGFGSSDESKDIYTETTKRALLVPFHFPPQSASSGIQRSLSFTKDLPGNGWQPIVMSANPIAYEQKNSSQLQQLPASAIVKRAFALDSKRHLGIRGRYPELIALPDRWVTWWLSAVPLGWFLIRRHRPEVIWSTFPISTAHLIGLSLQRLTGLPWVADFRDPMMQPEYPKSPRQRAFFHWIERKTLQHCAKAVFTTKAACESYRERYPHLPEKKFTVIENGYDEEGFAAAEAEVQKNPLTPASAKITLLHSGVLYTDGRDPRAFLAAVSALRQQGSLDANNFQVILRAPGETAYFEGLIEEFALHGIVQIAPPVPYRTALAEMLSVDGLLLFQGTPFNRQIPAKIYEYFRARRPVFGLLDLTGDTAQVLRSAGFHDLATMDDVDAIIATLRQFIQALRDGTAHVADDAAIYACSRKHRANQLAQVFDEVLADKRQTFTRLSHT